MGTAPAHLQSARHKRCNVLVQAIEILLQTKAKAVGAGFRVPKHAQRHLGSRRRNASEWEQPVSDGSGQATLTGPKPEDTYLLSQPPPP